MTHVVAKLARAEHLEVLAAIRQARQADDAGQSGRNARRKAKTNALLERYLRVVDGEDGAGHAVLAVEVGLVQLANDPYLTDPSEKRAEEVAQIMAFIASGRKRRDPGDNRGEKRRQKGEREKSQKKVIGEKSSARRTSQMSENWAPGNL